MELTPKVVNFLASLEGLVLEAYKDSVGVWTAFLGVTNQSGHEVYPRYKDNPQSMEKALEVSIWLLRTKYLPAVVKAFPNGLNEAQLAAALSFHWNTGAISRVDLPEDFMHWTSHGSLTNRRQMELDLFTKGQWPKDMTVPIYPVNKPSYSPSFRKGKRVDLTAEITAALKA
jgi:lysozyme